MTNLEIILITYIYIIMAIFIGLKVLKVILFNDKIEENIKAELYIFLTIFLAIIWPITLVSYLIKVIILDDWI